MNTDHYLKKRVLMKTLKIKKFFNFTEADGKHMRALSPILSIYFSFFFLTETKQRL